MSAQKIAAPSYRLRALFIVALLLVAFVVGAVTAVNLFPTAARERPLAGAAGATVQVQAADEMTRLIEFRAGERAGRAQAADEMTRLIEFRAGERASRAQAEDQPPLGR